MAEPSMIDFSREFEPFQVACISRAGGDGTGGCCRHPRDQAFLFADIDRGHYRWCCE